MLALCVTVVLLSAGAIQTAPLTCEDLIRPLDLSELHLNQTLGKWINVAESSEHLPYIKTNSAWIDVSISASNTSQNNTFDIALFAFSEIKQACFRFNSTYTLHDNGKLTCEFPVPAVLVLLSTCSDCLLANESFTINGTTYRSLELWTRTREVVVDLDLFMKQAACLRLPPVAVIDAQKELCPDTI
ncbi:hypothetical protein DPEC_G00140570 [Dallia pectoralis]|uniref:Uncharacterized protein n=1 Tax=Dallia pectoralis TaxID=75939 RepID=A0ACC2GMD5_DALPE|nr:hypothetical protein DPEC_G00140570 [Dallia pectoralis]